MLGRPTLASTLREARWSVLATAAAVLVGLACAAWLEGC